MANTTPEMIRIAVSTWFLNAGETTRAVEIAKAIRIMAKHQGLNVDMRFFSSSWSTDDKLSYENFVTNAGFPVTRMGPEITNEQWRKLIAKEHTNREFLDECEVEKVERTTKDIIQTLTEYNPTIVLHGFMDGVPMKIMGLPTIAYVPLPFTRDFMFNHVFDDIPEQKQHYGLSYLPKFVRRMLLHAVLSNPNLPTFTAQPSFRKAAMNAGWKPKTDGMIFDMIDADIVMVNDLKGNYDETSFDDHVLVTGPVFPHDHDKEKDDENVRNIMGALDPEILRIFDSKNPRKVFVSMGSSGQKEHLLVAIKALMNIDSRDDATSVRYNVVAIVPPTICPLDHFVKEELNGDVPDNIYLTDKFLPAKVVNSLADVAIIHGGQGTVQTAMGAGTPVVGIALQPEQRFNLNQVVRRGAGIRVSNLIWNDKVVGDAIGTVFSDESYKVAAQSVQKEMQASNGKIESAKLVLEFAQNHFRDQHHHKDLVATTE